MSYVLVSDWCAYCVNAAELVGLFSKLFLESFFLLLDILDWLRFRTALSYSSLLRYVASFFCLEFGALLVYSRDNAAEVLETRVWKFLSFGFITILLLLFTSFRIGVSSRLKLLFAGFKLYLCFP